MKAITKAWLKAAKDDLDVIERIINVAHLSHIVAFHAQQCIEKVFKALHEEHDMETKKTHNLINLYSRIEVLVDDQLDLQLLKTLDSTLYRSQISGRTWIAAEWATDP